MSEGAVMDTDVHEEGGSAIDIAAAARGSFRGFLVLVVGIVVFPLVARVALPVLSAWFVIVCVAGFTLAAAHQGRARLAAWQGAVAATGAFVLMLPQLLFGSASAPVSLLAMGGAAPFVGAMTGMAVLLRVRFSSRVDSGRGDRR